MNFERMLRQKATYWAPTGETDRYGKPIGADPQVFICRWEEKNSQIIDKKGEEQISKARVYLIEQVKIDGYLFLGESTDATPPVGSWQIQQVGTTPDIGNLQQLVTVYL